MLSAHLHTRACTLIDAARCDTPCRSHFFGLINRAHKVLIALPSPIFHGYTLSRYLATFSPEQFSSRWRPLVVIIDFVIAVFCRMFVTGTELTCLASAARIHASFSPARSPPFVFSLRCTPSAAHTGVRVAVVGGVAGARVRRRWRWHLKGAPAAWRRQPATRSASSSTGSASSVDAPLRRLCSSTASERLFA